MAYTDDDMPDGRVILSVDEMLMKGLILLGWQQKRLEGRHYKTNVDQYHGFYGMHPSGVAQVCEDLQTTKIACALVENLNVDKLHWALHFLYHYPTETERESTWNKCANTI